MSLLQLVRRASERRSLQLKARSGADDTIMVSRLIWAGHELWGEEKPLPPGLTDPRTALSFSAMPVAELAENHRGLVAARREVDYWRRLITARIDLAVAAVSDLEDLLVPPNAASYGSPCTPPAGLRDLIGIARLDDLDERLSEAALLTQLRRALDDLAGYMETLEAVTDEAANMLAYRLGLVA